MSAPAFVGSLMVQGSDSGTTVSTIQRGWNSRKEDARRGINQKIKFEHLKKQLKIRSKSKIS
ncbi:MAG: hypothetical protein JHC41_06830 [Nitrosopumilus sp.]|jgi:hypothetical protein|nr:hypothetical protein [Nitrosopumilus sp.]